MVTGGDMKAPVTASHGLRQFLHLPKVTVNALELCAGQSTEIAPLSQQGFDRMPAGNQFMDQVAADEAGGAGDEASHAAAMITFCAVSSNKFTYETVRPGLTGL
jgi:hypothetical protein